MTLGTTTANPPAYVHKGFPPTSWVSVVAPVGGWAHASLVRWSIERNESENGTQHLVVHPVDEDAAAEDNWPTAPKRLCSPRKITQRWEGTSTCEKCTTRLAGLLAYTKLVGTGRLVDRKRRSKMASNEFQRTDTPERLADNDAQRAALQERFEEIEGNEKPQSWPDDAAAAGNPFAQAMVNATARARGRKSA